MSVYKNPLPEQMGEVYDLRWNVLRDPTMPMDGTERDAYDSHPLTEHGAIWNEQFGGPRLVSTGRIHVPNETPDVGIIRYMATKPTWQGKGMGGILLQLMERQMLTKDVPVRLTRLEANARISALSFYEKLGYSAIGDEFELVGVPHVRIQKQVPLYWQPAKFQSNLPAEGLELPR